MIKDVEKWEAWLLEYERKRPTSFERNIKIYEALYEEAVALGVLPPKNPLEGIEFKIDFARMLNVSGTAGKDRSGS